MLSDGQPLEIGLIGSEGVAGVSVILGADFYRFLATECAVAAAIAGFTPVDVQLAMVELLTQVLFIKTKTMTGKDLIA